MQFSISQVAGAILTTASVSAAASWYLRGEQIDVLKEQVHAYESAQTLNLKDLTSSAKEAITALAAQLKKTNQLEQLEEKNTNLESELSNKKRQVDALTAELEDKSNTIKNLNSEISSLFSDHQQFTLIKSQVKKLFNAKFTFTINYFYYDNIDVILNNEKKNLIVGQYLDLNDGTKTCKIILEDIVDRERANFSVLCDK